MRPKIFFCIVLLLVTITGPMAQQPSQLLAHADELFDKKQYTEAYQLYLTIFNEHQQSSPEMLVKMAYIVEGLGDHGLALYYLNLYYRQTSEKAALKKMENLAKEHRLVGYDFDDFEMLSNFYHKHYAHIIYILVFLAIVFFILIYKYSRKSANRPIGLAIVYLFILSILFYLINFGNINSKGIITSEAYLMEAPSAAANLVDMVQKGHKVRILQEDDVWLRIKWDDRHAFIRKNNIIKLD